MAGIREEATIGSITYDEERGATVFFHCEGPGWGQGFGGYHLENDATRREFVAAVCATFAVADPELLIGKGCFVLRNFDSWGASIVGLESKDTGRRFIAWEWCAKRWPDSDLRDPLTTEIAALKSTIAWAEQRKRDAQEALKTVRDRFTDWRST